MKHETTIKKQTVEKKTVINKKELRAIGIIPNFKNHYNGEQLRENGERNILPSLAVPDMSLSVQEIIKRHTRGLPIFGTEMGYDHTYDPLGGRDINSLDIEEVWQIANQAREKYNTAQTKYIAEQKLKQDNELKKASIEEYKRLQEKATAGDVSQHAQKQNQGKADE